MFYIQANVNIDRPFSLLQYSKCFLFAEYMFRKQVANTETVNMEKRVYEWYSVGYLQYAIK